MSLRVSKRLTTRNVAIKMNLRKAAYSFLVIVAATFAIAFQASALITPFFSAGNTCGGASTAVFSTSGPSVQVSLCVTTTADFGGVCGTSIYLQTANAAESGHFNITARSLGAGTPAPSFLPNFPASITNPFDYVNVGNLGGSVDASLPPNLATNQLLATFDIQPTSTATNVFYDFGLNTNSRIYTAASGGNCFTSFATNNLPASITLIRGFTVTSGTTSANGTISPNTAQIVNFGASSSFTVTPSTGYTASVATTCGGALVGNTFTTGAITAPCSVVASFALNTYAVAPITTSANGTISPNTAQIISHGSTTAFTVAPNNGYTASVGGSCGGSLVGTTYTTNAISGPCGVVASFSLNTYAVTPSTTSANGTISPNIAQSISHGATAAFVVVANNGYTASVVSSCGGMLLGSTFTTSTIAAPCSVEASFAQGISSTTTLGSSLNPADAGRPLTLTAIVSGSAGTPTGNVEFRDAENLIVACASVSMSGGVAQCIVTGLSPGTRFLTARYLGSVAYGSSTSNTLTQTVNPSKFPSAAILYFLLD